MENFTPKSFWEKPEGKTGMFFTALLAGGSMYFLYKALPYLINIVENTLHLGLLLAGLGALIYMILDPKMRNLIFYMYKSFMRWITGLFILIDPIGILKSYIDDLKDNLKKMNKQIAVLKGQMRRLQQIMNENKKNINNNLKLASAAKEKDKKGIMILKSRKAGRLRESNLKLDELYRKMEILYRVLTKMYENSEILVEDIEDQVMVKEQERKAIRASHSAMKSAMNIISGNNDKKEMFDRALEAIADDVSMKIGEMERFMEMSNGFMDSIDLQNGIFEEEGLELLDKWEKEGVSLILGNQKDLLVNDSHSVDLDAPTFKQTKNHNNQYSDLFNF
ncbi:PspA/IM30 family protein [Tenacibaculum finnmarkense]|uniref:PspA/IM30 family protein n=1 Tax=Tenacibaculum finnmarkense TaxID=2781243 RepID=UPI003BB5E81C